MKRHTGHTRVFTIVHVSMIALALALSGCGGESAGTSPPAPVPTPAPPPPPPPPPPPSSGPAQVERDILPSTVNPALPANDSANFVINPDPTATARGRLFVMLPGTGAIPRNYRSVVRTGAARGYHGIGLTYVNATAVGELCSNTSSDLDCAGSARREIITGEDVSTLIAVNADQSITGRLTALLTALNRTYPTEGWGQFLRSGAVDWSLVTVAGHSQGAGHAAYMAKLYSLDRSVMFSGPADVPAFGQSASRWFSLPNITPVSRQYGFTHIEDELVPYALIRGNWIATGLDASAGAPFSVDGATAPYGNSHQLTTTAPSNPLGAAFTPFPKHSSPVADGVTPSDALGRSLYAPVWIYLAFP